MAPILKIASQHAKRFVLRNSIKTLPTSPARTTLSVLRLHRSQGSISTSLRHTRSYQTLSAPPDGWGYTLFDRDYDLNIVGSISYEAGVVANDSDLDLMFPKNERHVVEMLNAGLSHQLLQRFLDRAFRDGVVYLGALAMRLGAESGEGDMGVLREMVGCVRMYDEAREQMRAALKGYNPAGGYPWVFSCLGLLEEQWQGGVEGGEWDSWSWGSFVRYWWFCAPENLDSQSVDDILEKDFSRIPMSIPKEREEKIDADDAGAGEPKYKEAMTWDALGG